MRRSFLRQAFVVFASCALFLPIALDYGVTAQAATFSFSDNGCASYTLTDNGGGNFTLTCVPAAGGSFSCSISASPTGSPNVTQAITLNASCSNNAGSISYTWTGPISGSAGCPLITSGANTASAGLATPGGSTALQNCTYKLSANDTATTINPTRAISYSTSGGGGGGGGGPIDTSACTNQGLQALTLDLQWPTGQQAILTEQNWGGINTNQALVIRIHTSGVTTSTAKGWFSVVGQPQGSGGHLNGALSDQPCVFGPGLPLKGGGSASWLNSENSGIIYFTLLTTGKSGAATLNPNQDYYFNVRQLDSGTFFQLITFTKPSGT